MDEKAKTSVLESPCGVLSALLPRLSFAHFSQGVTVEKSSKLSSSGTAEEAIFLGAPNLGKEKRLHSRWMQKMKKTRARALCRLFLEGGSGSLTFLLSKEKRKREVGDRNRKLDAQEGRPQARLRLPRPSGQLHPHRPRARRAGPAVRDAGPQGEEAGRAVSVDRPHQRRGEGARGEKLHSSFFGFDYCFRVDVVLPLCGRKREEIGMRANICWQQTSALRFVVVVVDGLGFSSSSAHTSSCLSKKKKKPNSTTAHVLDFHRRAQGRQHRSQPQDPVGLCREGASELRGAGREGPGAAGEGGRRRRRRKQSEGRRRRRRRRWGLKRRERERKTSIFIRALSEMKGL